MDDTDFVEFDKNLGDLLFGELESDKWGGERDRLLLRNLAVDHVSIALSPSLPVSSGLLRFEGAKCRVSGMVLGEVLLTRLPMAAASHVSSVFLKCCSEGIVIRLGNDF